MNEIFDTHKKIWEQMNAPRPALLPPMTSPLVQPEYIFCRDAIDVAGKAKFGDQWTGEEQNAVLWTISPEAIWSTAWQNCLMRPLHRRLSVPSSLSGNGSRGVKGETEDEFAARKVKHQEDCNEMLSNVPESISKMQVLWKANHDATNRLMDVLQWLGDRCRSGAIQGAYIFKAGYKVFKLERDLWNGSSDLERWAKDGGFPIYANSAIHPTLAFMVRADLQREVASLQHAPLLVDRSDLSRLAPDLQLAVRLALKLELFGPGVVLHKILQGEIIDAAEAEGRRIAPEKARSMSATMRYPESPVPQKVKK